MQNLHEKMERRGFPKRQNKRCNSSQVSVKNTDQLTLAQIGVYREVPTEKAQVFTVIKVLSIDNLIQ